MLPKVYDRTGQLRTRQWVYDHYGFLHAHPPAGKPPSGARYALAELRETQGNVLTITVLAAGDKPVANVRIMLYWPDAPKLPASGWLAQGAIAMTNRHGQAIHVLGDGARYQPPTIGPHALWIHGPNASTMITGLGIVHDHHLAPTFRMLGANDPPQHNPIDEALRFLHSASKHMGTAIDDVAAAIERLECCPSPEPPHVPH